MGRAFLSAGLCLAAVLTAPLPSAHAQSLAPTPVDGHPADQQYDLDRAALVEGVMSGSVVGEPDLAGRDTVRATLGSAQTSYSLTALHSPSPYHAIQIPGAPPFPQELTDALRKALQIRTDFHLITGPRGEVFYMLKGSRKTLLIGTGSGAPGLAAMVRRLGGAGPLEVVLTDADPREAGGLAQLAPAKVYAAMPVRGHPTVRLKDGDAIDLGRDGAGRTLRLSVQSLGDGFTVLDPDDRILFAGGTLGVQGPDSGWTPQGGPVAYKAALTAWRTKTDGRYDILYTARNSQWFTSPAYVDQLSQALDMASAGAAPTTDSKVSPGLKLVKSDGAADVVASVGLP